MLTGTFAMPFYAGPPSLTRALDFVAALKAQDVVRVVSIFSPSFHVDIDEVRLAVETERMFNLMHWSTGIKVDVIVRKSDEYRVLEFERRVRQKVQNEKQEEREVWVASAEDLILSKLLWARDSGSELQRRDIKTLLGVELDRAYLDEWAAKLGVASLLTEIDS